MNLFETKRAAVVKWLEKSPHVQDHIIAEKCNVLEKFVQSERKFLGIAPAPPAQFQRVANPKVSVKGFKQAKQNLPQNRSKHYAKKKR